MAKKDALLIVHDVYQEHNLFPLGVGYIAAMLEKHGFSVEVYCMDVFHYTNEQLAKKLDESEYGLIGLGFMAARYVETIQDLCKVIHAHKKTAWFVLGGHGPSPIPEYMLKDTKADIVAIGEAEETFVELMKCKLSKEKDLSKVLGIAYTEKNKVNITPRRPVIKNLDSLPFPAWHLFPMDIYTTNMHFAGMDGGDKMFPIIATRGCINRCTFCYRMEAGVRVRSMQNVVEEVKALKDKYGVNVIYTADELFVVSKKRLLEFERLLKENNLKIKYTANARVDIFDMEIAEILKRTGCIFVNIGFESGTQNVLDCMKKNATVEQNVATLKVCKEVGLISGLNFIWGFSNDDRESLFRNVELIKKYNLYGQIRTIRPVTPYPGSEMYDEGIRRGIIKGPENFFERFKNSDLVAFNFTKFPTEQCHKWLFEANRELVLDHYQKTGQDIRLAEEIVQQFKELYEGRTTKFRGARRYEKGGKFTQK